MARTFVASLNDVDEKIRGEYEKQEDGTYKLKLEGDIPELADMKRKVAEFRDTNVNLMKKQEDHEKALKKFEGIDPDDHKKMKTRLEALEARGGSHEDIQAQVRTAVAAETAPLKEQIGLEKVAREQAEIKLKRRDLEGQLREVGTKLKVLPSAMKDFLSRGQAVYDLDGIPKDGENTIYSKEKPTEPMGMEEWGNVLFEDAPHLFEPSEGGNAGGSRGGQRGKRVMDGSDPVELGRHMDQIAKGEIIVRS